LQPAIDRKAVVIGILCGAGAALFWALGFVSARHGIDIGFSPIDLTVHRFLWAGIAFLPMVLTNGIADLNGIGWGRGTVLTLLGGPGLTLVSYAGFLLVPLGHGGVIQPSCAALGGLLLAAVWLKEGLPLYRALGALTIVAGLAVIGSEALTAIGAHGILGDLAFVAAGLFFAVFGMLLRLWRIPPLRGAAVISVLSLAGVPVYAALGGFEHMFAVGLGENLIQAVAQGVLAGPAAIYLFARSVILLGAGRAAVFPSLVPGFTLLIGYLVLGEVPSLYQLLGFAIVLAGFRLTQR
jgi:drug/metabolite transporter (DMT)-like permease